jgi:putative addiction module component (TIGR02574 family)
MLARSIKKLPLAEKILMVEELWDDISAHNKRLQPEKEEIDFVKQRLRDIKKAPDGFLSWRQIKDKARKSAK